MKTRLDGEQMIDWQLLAAGLPPPAREYRFAPPRRWRLDRAYVAQRIAMECEGATWVSGRHTRGSGFEADCAKYNEAALMGWLVLRFTAQQIESGQALAWIERAWRERAQCAV
jgi:hypothetical protein